MLYCPKTARGALRRLQNYVGQRLTANLPCGVLEPSKCAPRNYGAFEMCPAEFWSNATCALLSHGDIVTGAKIPTKNHLKLIYRSLRSFALCYPITSVKIYILKYNISFSQLTTINYTYLRYLSAIYIEICPSLHW